MYYTIDFETYSECDLKKAGAYVYSMHPSTEVICMGVSSSETENVDIRVLYDINGILNKLQSINDSGAQVVAHNAQFERCIWKNTLGLELPSICRWIDTAAIAAHYGLPRSLEGAGKALGLPIQKDEVGHKLMLRMCKPYRGKRINDSESLERLCMYCAVDVEAEELLYKTLGPLPEKECRLWQLDQIINDTGIHIDRESIEQIIIQLQAEEEQLLEEFKHITGLDSPRQVAKTIAWLASRGCNTENLQAVTVDKLFKTTTGQTQRAIAIRKVLSLSSVKKFQAMLNSACPDDRIRGTLLYCGASNTGRWSGRLIQPQNFPRGTIPPDEIEQNLFNLTCDTGVIDSSISSTASSLLRSCICAPAGKDLMSIDYSQIEARVLAWLANDNKTLEAFAAGVDVYELAARHIFQKREIDKVERHVGKTAVLALGYQGGIGAFSNLAIQTGLDLSIMTKEVLNTMGCPDYCIQNVKRYLSREDSELDYDTALACEIVKTRWRLDHADIVNLWTALQVNAVKAYHDPGKRYKVGLVEMKYDSTRDALKIKLPYENRYLSYYEPRMRVEVAPWGEPIHTLTTRYIEGASKKWLRRALYGGLITENITQATARNIMANAMLDLHKAGHTIIMTVHDEIVLEIDDSDSIESIQDITLSSGYIGLPIEIESWVGKRYRK